MVIFITFIDVVTLWYILSITLVILSFQSDANLSLSIISVVFNLFIARTSVIVARFLLSVLSSNVPSDA